MLSQQDCEQMQYETQGLIESDPDYIKWSDEQAKSNRLQQIQDDSAYGGE